MPARLSRPVVAGYAAGSVGTGGFATLPGLVIAYYLTDTLAVPALMATLAVLVPKVWDVVIDPAIGHLSDTEAARGTRTHLMLVGALTLPVGFVGMFAVPEGLGPWASAAWVTVAFVLATTSFSLFQVPYIALPADLTARLGDRAYSERTRLMAWRIAVLTFTILLVGAGGPALRDAAGNGHRGYLVMGVVTAGVVAVGMLATIVGVRGKRPAAEAVADVGGFRAGLTAWREHQPFRVLLSVFVLQALATGIMLAAAQYIATYTLGDQSALTFVFAALVAPALLTMPLWTAAGHRWGKKAGLILASSLFAAAALGLVALVWVPGWWAFALIGLAGVAYAGMQLFPLAMLPDVIDEAGRARGGAMSGLWTAAETAGLALGPAIVLLTLGIAGFVSSTATDTVTQPTSALVAIVATFSVIPALIVALSLVVLTRYPETTEVP